MTHLASTPKRLRIITVSSKPLDDDKRHLAAGSTALSFFILQRTCRLDRDLRDHDRLLWPPKPRGSMRSLPPRSVRRPGSLAVAKRRPNSRTLGLEKALQ